MNNSLSLYGEVGFYLSQQSNLENAVCDSSNYPGFEKLSNKQIGSMLLALNIFSKKKKKGKTVLFWRWWSSVMKHIKCCESFQDKVSELYTR